MPNRAGGVDIVNPPGQITSSIAAPCAKDATGKPVPTSFTVHGNTLTQHLNPGPDTVYPILADPDANPQNTSGSSGGSGGSGGTGTGGSGESSGGTGGGATGGSCGTNNGGGNSGGKPASGSGAGSSGGTNSSPGSTTTSSPSSLSG